MRYKMLPLRGYARARLARVTRSYSGDEQPPAALRASGFALDEQCFIHFGLARELRFSSDFLGREWFRASPNSSRNARVKASCEPYPASRATDKIPGAPCDKALAASVNRRPRT